MAELLEEKGIKVIALDLPENVSGSKAFVQRPDREDVPVIVVNQGHNGERQRFTLAHELAHLVLRFNGLSDAEQEKAADRFAGAFLMARDMVLRLLGRHRTSISLGELAEVPQRMERLCLRAVAEGAISEPRPAELLRISVRELDRRLMGQFA